MKVLFAGTPEVAVPSLEALLASDHEVVGVLTRPDARAGRGRRSRPSPVREVAEAAGVPVLAPERLGAPGVSEEIAALGAQGCAVVAYGALVPPALLVLPPHGWVNLHFSLLPAWRGAAPVQHAVLAGDDVTGAVTFLLEEGLDTGPVLGRLTETVRADDTSGALLGRLANAGAGLLVATFDGLEAGTLVAQPQPSEGVSLAPKLEVDDARVDWARPAFAVDRLVRATTPAPGAWTTWRGERLKLQPVEVVPATQDLALAPGEIRADKREVLVGTGSGPVRLGVVQPHGKKPMPAADWARGVRPEEGESVV
ncbi:methionyl-tRNA formyltransferase [Ornithinimicrobium tianjinense]|uniref:Methionyl-tRNA formyltransferase n=1 Tax=Ornithinimicrobium tianjinense TaxID=1195761 RepID=A0A917BL09_9MICO|nr:methionyl-tRNA formyltransferase [Ornithinimicrobium tianjinense]GGF48357.1 methionyl-tRNA formyltransferase [Ornithinimicrobium tianjinense]